MSSTKTSTTVSCSFLAERSIRGTCQLRTWHIGAWNLFAIPTKSISETWQMICLSSSLHFPSNNKLAAHNTGYDHECVSQWLTCIMQLLHYSVRSRAMKCWLMWPDCFVGYCTTVWLWLVRLAVCPLQRAIPDSEAVSTQLHEIGT